VDPQELERLRRSLAMLAPGVKATERLRESLRDALADLES
jgi:hypothetical protein